MSAPGQSAESFDPLAMLAKAKRRRMTPERFWARVNRGAPDACWDWTGPVNEHGYGRVMWCGKDTVAHRIAYALAKGAIPAGLVVMHACDRPPCCAPHHLSLGTFADNNRDMFGKGRGRTLTPAPGESNVNAKLTADLVREYRAAWHAGETLKSITARSGLSVGTVHPMLHGHTWAHVDDPQRIAPIAAGLANLVATSASLDLAVAQFEGLVLPTASPARGAR